MGNTLNIKSYCTWEETKTKEGGGGGRTKHEAARRTAVVAVALYSLVSYRRVCTV